jgi:plasmid stability protein
MPLSLSIKNVPDDPARRLRDRAERNHRSLQRELLVILDEATTPRIRPAEVLARVRALGLQMPSESVRFIRRIRDGR